MTEDVQDVRLFEPVEKPRSRRRRRRKRFRWIRKHFKSVYLAYALVPLVLLVVVSAALAADAISKISQSQQELSTVFNTLNNKPATDLTMHDYEQIDAALLSLENALDDAKQRTLPLQVFAYVDQDAGARVNMMNTALHAIRGSRHFLAGLKPTVVLLESGGVAALESDDDNTILTPVASLATGEESAKRLRAGRGRFLEAQEELIAAREMLNSIDLEGVSPDVLLEIETLKGYLDEIETLNAIALEAPELLTLALGLDEAQTYLVLAQNSDELRPSGGFISTWGWMRVRNGRILDYDYFASTATSPDPPPQALGSTLNIPTWWSEHIGYTTQPIYAAWDASWYAHFPQTAAMAAWYYNNGDNLYTPVDGVIAIDIVAFEYLVGALGEIEMPAYDVIVTGANFREVVYGVRADDDGQVDHKEFLAELYGRVIEKWQAVDPNTRSQVNRALLRALREKHIMLYFQNEDVQAATERMGWAGSQTPAVEHDYIMVADANLGSKSSRSVQRQINYTATLNPDNTVTGDLSIEYQFSAIVAEADPAVRPEHYNQQDYFSILQTFLPADIDLLDASEVRDGEMEIVPENNHTILTGLVMVPYGESTQVDINYTTPPLIEKFGSYYRYRLLLEKQPGSLIDVAVITINLPRGMALVSISPAPTAEYDLGQVSLEYNTLTLQQDQWIEIIYTASDN